MRESKLGVPSLFALVVAAGLALPADGGAYVIDSKSGGDCTTFGSWSSRTKTCTLTRDISAEESSVPVYLTPDGYVTNAAVIVIQNGGVTLDGNGYALFAPAGMYVPPGQDFHGIYLIRKNSVTVRNLTVRGFTMGNGIYAEGSAKSRISGLTVNACRFEGCAAGLHLQSASGAVISGNEFGEPGLASPSATDSRVHLVLASGLTVRDNIFRSTVEGTSVTDSELTGNTFLPASLQFLWGSSDGNVIAGNSFVRSFDPPYYQRGEAAVTGTANIVRENLFDHVSVMIGAGGNTLYHNNFISRLYEESDPSRLQSLIVGPSTAGDAFSLPAPTGGNYYNWYDDAQEGCLDGNADGFCDAPIWFGYPPTSPDLLPFTTANGWLP